MKSKGEEDVYMKRGRRGESGTSWRREYGYRILGPLCTWQGATNGWGHTWSNWTFSVCSYECERGFKENFARIHVSLDRKIKVVNGYVKTSLDVWIKPLSGVVSAFSKPGGNKIRMKSPCFAFSLSLFSLKCLFPVNEQYGETVH